MLGVALAAFCGGVVGFVVGRSTDNGTETASKHVAPTRLTSKRTVQLAQAHLSTKSWLFSQDAAGGSLRGADDQHLRLTLTGVRAWVTRFTDRPARDAQTVDIRDFLRRWDARFAKSPPNAVLSYRLPNAGPPRDIVLELRSPRYDATSHTVTYAARRIVAKWDDLPQTKYSRPRVSYPLPSTFSAASLFIDDSGTQYLVNVQDIQAANGGGRRGSA